MMNRAEMVRKSDLEAKLPVLTDQEVRENLRRKVELVRKGVESRFRIASYPDGETLFSITAEEQSHLRGMNWMMGAIGRVETDSLQRLGFEVMKEYGFDENISRPTYHNKGWTKDGISHGLWSMPEVSKEMRTYPSQTIDGLVFERSKEFVAATGQALSVHWRVVDNASPFRIKLGKKARK